MSFPRKRSGSNSKKSKEKFEILFKVADESDELSESLLIEITNSFQNLAFENFELEIQKANLENAAVKKNLNSILKFAIKTIEFNEDEKKISASLRTLSLTFFCLMKKSNGLIQTFLEDEDLKVLFKNCHNLLNQDSRILEEQTISNCVKFILIVLTGVDNLNENQLIEYLMVEDIFESLIQIVHFHRLTNGDEMIKASDIVMIIILLCNYHKYQSTNPYICNLSILADEQILNSFSTLINDKLVEFSRQYSSTNLDSSYSSSWLTSLSSLVGRHLFISDDDNDRCSSIKANYAILLALYENIHLNRNFITTLSHTSLQNDSQPPSPSNTLQSSAQSTDLASPEALLHTVTPTNLFVSLFEYCSIIMKDAIPESIFNTKLCFIILTCISEDSYANSLINDQNLNFKVLIHRATMRHRKPTSKLESQPLSATLLDLTIEFIVSHMSKQRFPMDLYLFSVGIIQRLLVYQKRCNVRLNYNWKALWSALINLIKFLVYQEPYLIKKFNIFILTTKIINIFNFFISYGDTFLRTTQNYDELYYELNREEKIFSEVHALVLRYSAISDTEFKDDVLKLLNSLVNILKIEKHFNQKIKEWLASKSLSTPSEEQILAIVRENYDLNLTMIPNLDVFERYNEQKHNVFFNGIISEVIGDLRSKNCAKFLNEVAHA